MPNTPMAAAIIARSRARVRHASIKVTEPTTVNAAAERSCNAWIASDMTPSRLWDCGSHSTVGRKRVTRPSPDVLTSAAPTGHAGHNVQRLSRRSQTGRTIGERTCLALAINRDLRRGLPFPARNCGHKTARTSHGPHRCTYLTMHLRGARSIANGAAWGKAGRVLQLHESGLVRWRTVEGRATARMVAEDACRALAVFTCSSLELRTVEVLAVDSRYLATVEIVERWGSNSIVLSAVAR